MYISSRENPHIKKLVKLITSRKARNEYGEFVVEGMRNCTDAVSEQISGGRMQITAVFYTKKSLEKYSGQLPTELFDRLDERLRFEISQELADKISDSENGQGVFCIAKKPDKKFCADTINSGGKYIVLDNVQDPGNLGTILRTADAVGMSGAVLTNNCCDLYNPKVIRAAMGSIARVDTFVENDFSAVVELMREKEIVNVASVISGGENIAEFDFGLPCAVYIGNEGSGMPQEHIKLCDKSVTISMQGRINSLNAGAAATIILWEMFR